MLFVMKTESVYGRHDWYKAITVINGITYHAFMDTRDAAIHHVLEQLHVKGIINY